VSGRRIATEVEVVSLRLVPLATAMPPDSDVSPAQPYQTARDQNPIQAKLIWLLSGVILLSGAMAAVTLFYLRKQAVHTGIRQTESVAHIVEEQTSRTFQGADQALQLALRDLGQLEAAGGLDETSARAVLRKAIKDVGFMRAMWVMDATGRIIFSSEETNMGIQLADRDYFQAHRDGHQDAFYIGAPVLGRTTGTWGFGISRSLPPRNGAFAGVVAAALEPLFFDQSWRALDLGAGASVALLRRDGRLLIRSRFNETAMGQTFPDPLFDSSPPAGRARRKSRIDGVEREFAYRWVSTQPGLVVMVGRPYDLLLAPWRQLAALSLAIWALASMAIAYLGLLLNRAWQQRAQSEVQTRQIAERLSLATSTASIGVWEWDPAAGTFYANSTYFSMLGHDPKDEFLDRDRWLDQIHPEDRGMVADKIRDALASSDIPYRYEARVLHADGSYRWVSSIAKVLTRDALSHATRVLGVRIDITERRQADEALGVSDQALKAISQGVVIMSPELGILSANDAFTLITGYGGAEVTGQTSPFLEGPNDRS